MAEGYIKLYRTLLDNPIIKKPDYLCIWNCLLLLASYKDTTFIFNNIKQTLKPGQLITGRKKLSKITGIEEHKVYRILNYLKSEQQIEQQSNNQFTIITILNWEKYQGDNVILEQQNEQPVSNQRATSEQPVSTFKNIKNIKKEKNNIPYTEILNYLNAHHGL